MPRAYCATHAFLHASFARIRRSLNASLLFAHTMACMHAFFLPFAFLFALPFFYAFFFLPTYLPRSLSVLVLHFALFLFYATLTYAHFCFATPHHLPHHHHHHPSLPLYCTPHTLPHPPSMWSLILGGWAGQFGVAFCVCVLLPCKEKTGLPAHTWGGRHACQWEKAALVGRGRGMGSWSEEAGRG